MPNLNLTRQIPASPERVFAAITEPGQTGLWWGPEGFRCDPQTSRLDFTKTGPWVTEMISPEGQRFKVSGQVTHVTPLASIGFTWAWHDDRDARGDESHVTITVAPDGAGGTTLSLTHIDLEEEAATSHEKGWESTFNKLVALVTA